MLTLQQSQGGRNGWVAMTDVLDPETRSLVMSRIRGKDTKPEMLVRRLIHSLGYRYRLHDARLPGKPDLVFASRRKAVFVHGCFWHQHTCPKGARQPKTQVDFWKSKLEGNVERDKRNLARLIEQDWGVLVIWECETKDRDSLKEKITRFLEVGNEST